MRLFWTNARNSLWRFFAAGLLLVLFSFTATASPLHFPALTGRVVDEAHVLSPQAIESLDQKLAEYESGTTNQVVVVTLASLQGDGIEDYGYRLGRAWGIGQKGKNNGVVLIVAPAEHKVRLEVGYGNEALLTDAASSEIVNGIIVPAFKRGDVEGGIVQGTDAILSVLGGHGAPVAAHGQQEPALAGFINFALVILLLILFIRHPSFWLAMALNNSFRSGSSSFGNSGWSGGSGFSGGGGSFGGGGASGSW